jgi:hypothetical protein
VLLRRMQQEGWLPVFGSSESCLREVKRPGFCFLCLNFPA